MNNFDLLYLCGVYNTVLVLFHILFWKIFNWKITLDKGTKVNKVIMQIMNIQLIYLFLFMAFVYFYFTKELIQSNIGNAFLFGYAGFWIVRFFQQIVFVKHQNKFTVGLTILFLVGAMLHTLILFFL